MNETPRDALYYFSGGVPAGAVFAAALSDLERISTSEILPKTYAPRLGEVCFIGLVSYFEAFCKDQFASILNLLPQMIVRLRDKGQDTNVDAVTLVGISDNPLHQIGFLLSERYDFGTAQKINALYSALLKITPFSKDEAASYSRILRDRNLLVHHGGTYTARYLAQISGAGQGVSRRPFMDSLVVSSEYLLRDLSFLKGIAEKMASSAQSAVKCFVEDVQLSLDVEQLKALDYLPYGLVGETRI